MTLERFGFIGMDKRCFWGSIGVLWKRPLPVDQILPNITVKAAPVPVVNEGEEQVQLRAKPISALQQGAILPPKRNLAQMKVSHLNKPEASRAQKLLQIGDSYDSMRF